MARKKERIDTSVDRQPLTDNPFAGLDGLGEAFPEAASPSEAPVCPVPSSPPWQAAKSRKGNYQISIERRAAGKTVTVLRGVSGDTGLLLAELKRACGTGGTLHEDAVELQGDQRARVEAFLNTHIQNASRNG